MEGEAQPETWARDMEICIALLMVWKTRFQISVKQFIMAFSFIQSSLDGRVRFISTQLDDQKNSSSMYAYTNAYVNPYSSSTLSR